MRMHTHTGTAGHCADADIASAKRVQKDPLL